MSAMRWLLAISVATRSMLVASCAGLAAAVGGLSANLRSKLPAKGAATSTLVQEESASSAFRTSSGFISVQGTRFVDEACNDFVVSGFNAWNLMEMRMGNLNVRTPHHIYACCAARLSQMLFHTNGLARRMRLLLRSRGAGWR